MVQVRAAYYVYKYKYKYKYIYTAYDKGDDTIVDIGDFDPFYVTNS